MVLKSKFGFGARKAKRKPLKVYLEFIAKQARSHKLLAGKEVTPAYKRERLTVVANELLRCRDELLAAASSKLSDVVDIFEWIALAKERIVGA